jgi:hypothetical protein
MNTVFTWFSAFIVGLAVLLGGSPQAIAQAPGLSSDAMGYRILNGDLVSTSLPEGQEPGSISLQVPGHSIDFLEAVGSQYVSDTVRFTPCTTTFTSDSEKLAPAPIANPDGINVTALGESVALGLFFRSDTDPAGTISDHVQFSMLDGAGNFTILKQMDLPESAAAATEGFVIPFDLPRIIVSMPEGDGTLSDILNIDPINIDITSDLETTLTPSGDLSTIETGQLQAVFTLAAVSDVPEPATLTLLSMGMLGVAAMVRRRR